MKPMDYLKALGVALFVMTCTLFFAFPMVAFYAYVIEPGHPQEFYSKAAQWIAPWSSHVLGPLLFFGLNFRLARSRPERNAMAFAIATIVAYVVIDAGSLPLFGVDIAAFFRATVLISLVFKAIGALLGARLGATTAA
jgi:hypothetical protein